MTPIWTVRPTLEALNAMCEDTLSDTLGMVFTEVLDDGLRAVMPVDRRTVQPLGLLHGGASVALAETMGSIGAFFCAEPGKRYGVGLEINANHIRSVREGQVIGTARPVHLGRTTHVWSVRVEDEQGRLVSISRMTLAILENQ